MIEIFYSGSGRNPSERFLIFSLFLGHSLLFRLEMKLCWCFLFFFFNFFAILLEFSVPCQVETHQNDFYYFLYFSAFPLLFWLEMKLWWCFFWIFVVFLFNFPFRVGKEHIAMIFIIFSLSLCLSHSILAWNEAMLVFSNFFNFFAFLFIFLLRVG